MNHDPSGRCEIPRVEEGDGEPMYWDRPNILLSIDPEWAEAILEGEKRWEYRRVAPDRVPPLRMILYATAPVSAVVGAAFSGQILKMEPDQLVDATVAETPHDPEDVLEYFDGADEGNALRIDARRRFDSPIDGEDLGEDRQPTQNFRYINTCGIPEAAIHV